MTEKQIQTTVGRIGFIGAGKAGNTLGLYFTAHGYTVSGYQSRSVTSANKAAQRTNSRTYETISELLKNSDTIFLTVPDGEIEDVVAQIGSLPKDCYAGRILCHVSGAMSSEIFLKGDTGMTGYSIHPLFAISDVLNSYKELSKCVFTIEGPAGTTRDVMEQMLRFCGNEVEIISAQNKALYHAAAVVVSNFVVGLSYLGGQMLEECGFSQANAERALLPLLQGSVDNIARQGSVQALTGPVERADAETVAKHLQALGTLDNHLMSDLYRTMTEVLIGIGQEKHPEYDYSSLSEYV
jgi:predicted short-subunit dehydrogenase-like oxidoreductase (DUF2520 family)